MTTSDNGQRPDAPTSDADELASLTQTPAQHQAEEDQATIDARAAIGEQIEDPEADIAEMEGIE